MKAAAEFHRMTDWLKTVPEVANVSYGTAPMMGTWTPPIFIKRPGAVEGAIEGRTLAGYASDNFLNTLSITILRGRNFTAQESSAGAHVAVVSASTARLFWPNEDPVGKHFQLDLHFDGKQTDFEIIGIVKDVRFANLTRVDPARVYLAADPDAALSGVLQPSWRSAGCDLGIVDSPAAASTATWSPASLCGMWKRCCWLRKERWPAHLRRSRQFLRCWRCRLQALGFMA